MKAHSAYLPDNGVRSRLARQVRPKIVIGIANNTRAASLIFLSLRCSSILRSASSGFSLMIYLMYLT